MKIDNRGKHMLNRFGKNNNNYKDGRTLKKYYCECGKEVWYRSVKCRKCADEQHSKRMKGKNNPNWKSGKQKCIDCGKQLKNIYAKRCRFCEDKEKRYNFKYRNSVLKKVMKSNNLRPNKPEQLLNNLLNKVLPNEYKYNKKFIIAGLIPDFVNKKKKKIIELYGDYWHNRKEVKLRDKNRVGIYELFANYKTLIIWEHELKDLEKVISKIMEFNLKEE